MAEITKYPFFRHLRSDASSHILHYRKGKLLRSGRGLSFWFAPMSASLAEVPVDTRELALIFHGRSADFQDVTTQGVLTFRVTDAAALAERFDFTIDLAQGRFVKEPLEKLALLLSELAQQHAWGFIARTPLREVLGEGQAEIRERVEAGLAADKSLRDLGLAIVSVRISSIKPSPDLEKALEAPMREKIQQESDEAAFQRRALAVEKERAIQENELQNQIELSRREEQLIAQRGQNARRQATEEAEAHRIAAEAEGQRIRLGADVTAQKTRVEGAAQADALKLVETARAEGERARMAAYEGVPPAVLLGLAAQGLATKLQRIDHLNLSPDLLAPILSGLAEAAARRLDAGTPAKKV
jgi:regulator of protease activity HflC (stomatin/prohibitin superfamily)